MPARRTIALVDGTPFLYRAEFGFPARITNRRGDDITGLFGTLALLRKALRSAPERPSHAVVVFDADAPLSRADRDPRYKSGRRPPADEHNPFRHLASVRRGLARWGLAVVEHERAEADDVIATLAGQWEVSGTRLLVLSGDKDFHQLLGPRLTQWNPALGPARGVVTAEALYARHRVLPGQWPDYLALIGDRADGLPGIRGIGPVGARRLLRDGRMLDDVPESELAAEDRREALAQRALHRLCRDVPRLDVEPAAVDVDGLIDAAGVVEQLGAWGAAPSSAEHPDDGRSDR